MQHITNSKFYRGLLSLLKEQGNDSPEMREKLRNGLANLSEFQWDGCKRVSNIQTDKRFWLSSSFTWVATKEGAAFWVAMHNSVGGAY